MSENYSYKSNIITLLNTPHNINRKLKKTKVNKQSAADKKKQIGLMYKIWVIGFSETIWMKM